MECAPRCCGGGFLLPAQSVFAWGRLDALLQNALPPGFVLFWLQKRTRKQPAISTRWIHEKGAARPFQTPKRKSGRKKSSRFAQRFFLGPPSVPPQPLRRQLPQGERGWRNRSLRGLTGNGLALSVTCGDSSPKGGASGETGHFVVLPETFPPCQGLSLWESCRAERG